MQKNRCARENFSLYIADAANVDSSILYNVTNLALNNYELELSAYQNSDTTMLQWDMKQTHSPALEAILIWIWSHTCKQITHNGDKTHKVSWWKKKRTPDTSILSDATTDTRLGYRNITKSAIYNIQGNIFSKTEKKKRL